MVAKIEETTLTAFVSGFAGRVLQDGDVDYDECRRVQNGMIDRRPAAIAVCRGTADIVDAVKFGVANGLDIAIRAGGHNVAGNSVCEGGLMIDLAGMQGVHVDPARKTVRVQPGVTWGLFNRETQLHALATTGGVVSTTGVAGLTLGGGLGWLMGKYGMSVDNLLSAEMVTASGDCVVASARENEDLFWALRGGGGNFGVVSSFEFQLHPVGPMVTGGVIAFPIERARDILRFYRDFTASAPDELTAFGGLLHAPDGSGLPLAGIIVCHCGSLQEGEAAVQPLKQLGEPLLDAIGPVPYSTLNTMLDAGFPKGALNYWKSNFLNDLNDDAIETAIEQFQSCPSPMSGLLFEHFHGAATRVGESETAFPHRRTGYNFLAASEWLDPGQTDTNVAWARAAYAAMQPFMARGSYMNYLGEGESEDVVAASFGANYERLQKVKGKYDPDNVFHLNQNIKPAK